MRRISKAAVASALLAGLAWIASPARADLGGTGPAWWTTRGVLTTNNPPNDFAPATLGQLKWIATQARNEFDAVCPGGAGAAINALVDGFSQTDNFAPVLIGQAKQVSHVFYDRLAEFGYTNGYPWSGVNPNDVAPLNIGQLKTLFDLSPNLATVSVTTNPAVGGTVTGAGAYVVGATVTLIATPASPAWFFASWSDGDTNATRTLTVPAGGTNLAAEFIAFALVSVTTNPAVGGSVSGAGTYVVGSTATLVATPTNSGWIFTSWSDGVTNATRNITVPPGGTNLTASFRTRAPRDFDGDGKSDLGCYFADGGNWFLMQSHDGFKASTFGFAGTVPVAGDFDGDGRTDYGCYYAPGGNWYLMQSRDGFKTATFGYSGTVPVVGDFDGDGRTDYGCYYAPGGNWYLMQSRDGFKTATFGYSGTVPVVGDFDGDGKADYGCYYAPGGNWYLMESRDGFKTATFGYSGTVPVVGDFDGDGKADYGCYYAPGGNWYLMESRDGFKTATFGYAGTVPVVGDFDGDGKADYGCYYAPGGNWYLMQSKAGFRVETFGFTGTVPLGL